jgi:hypothetical protein
MRRSIVVEGEICGRRESRFILANASDPRRASVIRPKM